METFIFDWWRRSRQSLAGKDLRIFRFCVMLWKAESETQHQILSGEDILTWFKNSSQYRTMDTIDGEPMEFEWNIFPGFTKLQLIDNVQEFVSKMSDPSEF